MTLKSQLRAERYGISRNETEIKTKAILYSLDEIQPVERISSVVLEETSRPTPDRFGVSTSNIVRTTKGFRNDRNND